MRNFYTHGVLLYVFIKQKSTNTTVWTLINIFIAQNMSDVLSGSCEETSS